MAKSKKRIKIKWIRLFLFIFVLYALFIIADQQFTLHRLNKTRNEIIKEIEVSQMENEKLRDMLENVTSKEYIEKMAREQLGLVKSGETVYIDQSSSDVYLHEGGN